MRKTNYKSKRCPRCGTKNTYVEQRCTSCGLVFSRVENGSNKIAKGLLMAGKKDEVVLARMFPKDVRKKKFLLLCGFWGMKTSSTSSVAGMKARQISSRELPLPAFCWMKWR